MSIEYKFTGRVDGQGILRLDAPHRYAQALEELHGQRVGLTISDARSLAQNKRYWSVVVETIRQYYNKKLGIEFTKEAVHDQLAGETLGWEPRPDGSKRPKSTSKLSVRQFNDYMTEVEATYAQEHGIYFAERGEEEF
jgi:hypothetical protein